MNTLPSGFQVFKDNLYTIVTGKYHEGSTSLDLLNNAAVMRLSRSITLPSFKGIPELTPAAHTARMPETEITFCRRAVPCRSLLRISTVSQRTSSVLPETRSTQDTDVCSTTRLFRRISTARAGTEELSPPLRSRTMRC